MRPDLKDYVEVTRRSSLFAVEAVAPLAVVYEALVFLDPHLASQFPSADPVVKSLILLIGRHGLGLLFLLAVFFARASATLAEQREAAQPRLFYVLLAALEGTMAGVLLAGVLQGLRRAGLWKVLHPLIPLEEMALPGITLSFAAGFSEELIFRFFVQSGSAVLLREVASVRVHRAEQVAIPWAALLLALAHHLGPGGAPFSWPFFLIRLLGPGLLFGVLYYYRGLAFVAYLHAMFPLAWLALRC